MKRILSAILAAAIFIALTSCGEAGEQAKLALENAKVRIENGEASESGSESESDLALEPEPGSEDDLSGWDGDMIIPPPVTAGSLPGWMKSGSFYFDYVATVDIDAVQAEVTGSMAGQDGDFSFSMNASVLGSQIKTRLLILGGAIYAIDDVNRTVTEPAEIPAGMMNGIISDYSGITLETSGTGEINGRVLPWEEYTENGTFIRYYFDGGEVYAMEIDGNGVMTTMLISNAANAPPPEMFALPLDYEGALPEAQNI